MSKIQSYTTHVVAVPREPGASTDRTDRPPATVFVTLQLRTNDGIEGIGHATLVPWSMNDALKAAVDALAQEVSGTKSNGCREYRATSTGRPERDRQQGWPYTRLPPSRWPCGTFAGR